MEKETPANTLSTQVDNLKNSKRKLEINIREVMNGFTIYTSINGYAYGEEWRVAKTADEIKEIVNDLLVVHKVE